MSDAPSAIRAPLSGPGQVQGRDVRARAWRFVFDCYAKKKAGEGDAGDGMKGPEHDHPAGRILSR